MASKDYSALFTKFGFEAKKIKTVVKNESVADRLYKAFENKDPESTSQTVVDLIYNVIGSKSKTFETHEDLMLDLITKGEYTSKQ